MTDLLSELGEGTAVAVAALDESIAELLRARAALTGDEFHSVVTHTGALRPTVEGLLRYAAWMHHNPDMPHGVRPGRLVCVLADDPDAGAATIATLAERLGERVAVTAAGQTVEHDFGGFRVEWCHVATAPAYRPVPVPMDDSDSPAWTEDLCPRCGRQLPGTTSGTCRCMGEVPALGQPVTVGALS